MAPAFPMLTDLMGSSSSIMQSSISPVLAGVSSSLSVPSLTASPTAVVNTAVIMSLVSTSSPLPASLAPRNAQAEEVFTTVTFVDGPVSAAVEAATASSASVLFSGSAVDVVVSTATETPSIATATTTVVESLSPASETDLPAASTTGTAAVVGSFVAASSTTSTTGKSIQTHKPKGRPTPEGAGEVLAGVVGEAVSLINSNYHNIPGQVYEEPVTEVPGAEDPIAEDPVAEEPVGENPPAVQPVPEEAVSEEPVSEEPVSEAPVGEEPVTGVSVAEDSVAEDAVAEDAVAENPLAEGPGPEEAISEEPVSKKPASEEPVSEEPVAGEPVAGEPVAEEPVAEEPVAEEPVAEEPVVEEHVAEEPVVEEHVAEDGIAEEPVAEKPIAEEPVAEEPVIEEPAAEESSVGPLEEDPFSDETLYGKPDTIDHDSNSDGSLDNPDDTVPAEPEMGSDIDAPNVTPQSPEHHDSEDDQPSTPKDRSFLTKAQASTITEDVDDVVAIEEVSVEMMRQLRQSQRERGLREYDFGEARAIDILEHIGSSLSSDPEYVVERIYEAAVNADINVDDSGATQSAADAGHGTIRNLVQEDSEAFQIAYVAAEEAGGSAESAMNAGLNGIRQVQAENAAIQNILGGDLPQLPQVSDVVDDALNLARGADQPGPALQQHINDVQSAGEASRVNRGKISVKEQVLKIEAKERAAREAQRTAWQIKNKIKKLDSKPIWPATSRSYGQVPDPKPKGPGPPTKGTRSVDGDVLTVGELVRDLTSSDAFFYELHTTSEVMQGFLKAHAKAGGRDLDTLRIETTTWMNAVRQAYDASTNLTLDQFVDLLDQEAQRVFTGEHAVDVDEVQGVVRAFGWLDGANNGAFGVNPMDLLEQWLEDSYGAVFAQNRQEVNRVNQELTSYTQPLFDGLINALAGSEAAHQHIMVRALQAFKEVGREAVASGLDTQQVAERAAEAAANGIADVALETDMDINAAYQHALETGASTDQAMRSALQTAVNMKTQSLAAFAQQEADLLNGAGSDQVKAVLHAAKSFLEGGVATNTEHLHAILDGDMPSDLNSASWAVHRAMQRLDLRSEATSIQPSHDARQDVQAAMTLYYIANDEMEKMLDSLSPKVRQMKSNPLNKDLKHPVTDKPHHRGKRGVDKTKDLKVKPVKDIRVMHDYWWEYPSHFDFDMALDLRHRQSMLSLAPADRVVAYRDRAILSQQKAQLKVYLALRNSLVHIGHWMTYPPRPGFANHLYGLEDVLDSDWMHGKALQDFLTWGFEEWRGAEQEVFFFPWRQYAAPGPSGCLSADVFGVQIWNNGRCDFKQVLGLAELSTSVHGKGGVFKPKEQWWMKLLKLLAVIITKVPIVD